MKSVRFQRNWRLPPQRKNLAPAVNAVADSGQTSPARIGNIDDMHIQAIPTDELIALRQLPISRAHVRIQAAGGEPLRCCLREAEPDESLLLTGYSPPFRTSPYAETGPVYIHASACQASPPDARFPQMSLIREQLLRSYDERHWILDSALAPAGQARDVAARLLADPRAAFVDVRNPGHGCFMFRVTAAPGRWRP
ncbi:DUF1203 domain-containing protein [Dermacoccaceae bacterium W4C1]